MSYWNRKKPYKKVSGWVWALLCAIYIAGYAGTVALLVWFCVTVLRWCGVDI